MDGWLCIARDRKRGGFPTSILLISDGKTLLWFELLTQVRHFRRTESRAYRMYLRLWVIFAHEDAFSPMRIQTISVSVFKFDGRRSVVAETRPMNVFMRCRRSLFQRWLKLKNDTEMRARISGTFWSKYISTKETRLEYFAQRDIEVYHTCANPSRSSSLLTKNELRLCAEAVLSYIEGNGAQDSMQILSSSEY